MKNNTKLSILIATLICLILILTPVGNAGFLQNEKQNRLSQLKTNNGFEKTPTTDYWALIFAVGVYKNHPDEDRPSMLEAADDLYDVLTSSPEWSPDHIHVVKGSQATGQNLIRELIWLIKNVDNDDLCLVYLTTHGAPMRNSNGLPMDLPPKDEADGADELLVMYEGFDKWYAVVWDDLLNFFLSLIKTQGLCLIVDSCYSGGFDDSPFKSSTEDEYTVDSFKQGFGEELAGQNRVVLMSCEENELSYGSDFSDLLIDGFAGMADLFGNQDGINSAEESFSYADFWIELFGEQHPTIYDSYPGDFPVTS